MQVSVIYQGQLSGNLLSFEFNYAKNILIFVRLLMQCYIFTVIRCNAPLLIKQTKLKSVQFLTLQNLIYLYSQE